MEFKRILRTFLKIVLPLVFGGLLLWFLYREMDITEIWRVVKEGVRYDIILFSLLFGLFANVVRGLRWGLLIRSLGERFKMTNAVYAVLGNYAVNLVLPRVGEVWRCGMVTRYDKISFRFLCPFLCQESSVARGIPVDVQFDLDLFGRNYFRAGDLVCI